MALLCIANQPTCMSSTQRCLLSAASCVQIMAEHNEQEARKQQVNVLDAHERRSLEAVGDREAARRSTRQEALTRIMAAASPASA